MKVYIAIAVLTLSGLGDVCSAPPDADKAPLTSTAKPGIRFSSYHGDPNKVDPSAMEFQLDHMDRRQPTDFLKLGDTVTGTKFRLTKFQFKTKPNPTGRDEDISELTLTNTETKQEIILILGR